MRYYAVIIVLAFMIGVGAHCLAPQPATAEQPGDCSCYTMAYCLSPAPAKCECPPTWDVITYDKTYEEVWGCGDRVCLWAPCEGGIGCTEDCYVGGE